MKKLLLLLSLLLATNAWAEAISLKCEGNFQETEAGYTSLFGFRDKNGGSGGSGITSQRSALKPTLLLFSFDESTNNASILLPLIMQPYSRSKKRLNDYIDLYDVSVTDKEIKGKLKFPGKLIKANLSINRVSGVLDYEQGDVRFSGGCALYNDTKKKF